MAGPTTAATPPDFDAEFFVPLRPFQQWSPGLTEKLVEELQQEFSKEFAGVDFNFSQYIQDNIEEGLSGVKGANSVKIMGPDLAVLEQTAAEVPSEWTRLKVSRTSGYFECLDSQT